MSRINTTTKRCINIERHNQLSTETTVSTIYFFEQVRPVLRAELATVSESGDGNPLPAASNSNSLAPRVSSFILQLIVTISLHNHQSKITYVTSWLHSNQRGLFA